MTVHRPDRRGWLVWPLVTALLHLSGAALAEDTAPKTTADDGLATLIYVPHDFDAPEVTESGGVRGFSLLPRVDLLAPPKLAPSFAGEPVLYWYLWTEQPAVVRVTLLDESDLSEAEPLLEISLPAVAEPGVYRIDLADHGIRLEPERLYRWSVAIEADSHSEEAVAATVLASIAPDPALLAKIDGAPPLERAVALAGNGYWYGAIDELSRRIAAGDHSEPWRQHRATLLEQVGLVKIAAHDRTVAGAQ